MPIAIPPSPRPLQSSFSRLEWKLQRIPVPQTTTMRTSVCSTRSMEQRRAVRFDVQAQVVCSWIDRTGKSRRGCWPHTQYQYLGSVCSLFVAPGSRGTRWPRDPSSTTRTQRPGESEVGGQRQSDARGRQRSGQWFRGDQSIRTARNRVLRFKLRSSTILHDPLERMRKILRSREAN